MERELIFWLGCLILLLTMTGGMWMFLENKPLGREKALGRDENRAVPDPATTAKASP